VNIAEMENQLNLLAASPCLDSKVIEATKHALVMLRGVKASLDLDWKTNAKDLYEITCNITHVAGSPWS